MIAICRYFLSNDNQHCLIFERDFRSRLLGSNYLRDLIRYIIRDERFPLITWIPLFSETKYVEILVTKNRKWKYTGSVSGFSSFFHYRALNLHFWLFALIELQCLIMKIMSEVVDDNWKMVQPKANRRLVTVCAGEGGQLHRLFMFEWEGFLKKIIIIYFVVLIACKNAYIKRGHIHSRNLFVGN